MLDISLNNVEKHYGDTWCKSDVVWLQTTFCVLFVKLVLLHFIPRLSFPSFVTP